MSTLAINRKSRHPIERLRLMLRLISLVSCHRDLDICETTNRQPLIFTASIIDFEAILQKT